MVSNPKTLNEIIKIFKDIADNHRQIEDFGYGDFETKGNSKSINYPLMWIDYNSETVFINGEAGNPTHIEMDIEISISDKINNSLNISDKHGEESNNGLEVTSDIVQIKRDIIAQLTEHSFYIKNGITVRNDITDEKFYNISSDTANEIRFTLTLRFPFNLTVCGSPFKDIAIVPETDYVLITDYESDNSPIKKFIGESYTCELPVATTYDYIIRFWDYDGTLLKEQGANDGDVVIPPSDPSHDLLTFKEWNQDTSNITSHLDVGATYDITDDNARLFISLTDATGLSGVQIYATKTDTDLMTVHWGDGETSTLTVNGYAIKPNPYPAIGNYTIMIECAGEYRVGKNSEYLFGSETAQKVLTEAWLNTQYTSSTASLSRCVSMKTLLLTNNVEFTSGSGFSDCTSLNAIIFPKSLKRVWNSLFSRCQSIIVVSATPNVETTLNSAFSSCFSLRRIIYYADGRLDQSLFTSNYSSTSVTLLPNNQGGITSYYNSCFLSNYTLRDFTMSDTITEIGINTFYRNYALENITLSNTLESIGNASFRECFSLKEIVIPATITLLGTSVFYNSTSLIDYQFLSVVPPTLTSTTTFFGINAITKIYVPDASVAAYKAATNWTLVADYIYPISTRP